MSNPVGVTGTLVLIREIKEFEFWETNMSHMCVNASASTVVTLVMYIDNT